MPELARETTSSFGTSISSVALPLVALSVPHASVFAVTMLTAAAWLPWLLVGLPAGAWLDRLPRRRIMMVADLVSLFGSVPVAAALGWLTIAQLVVVALIAGTASVFFLTVYRAFLPALLDAGDLLEGNAKLQGSEQVTHIAGPAAAGLIAQATSGGRCARRCDEFRGLGGRPGPRPRDGIGPGRFAPDRVAPDR